MFISDVRVAVTGRGDTVTVTFQVKATALSINSFREYTVHAEAMMRKPTVGLSSVNKKFCSTQSRVNATGLSINVTGIIQLDAEKSF